MCKATSPWYKAYSVSRVSPVPNALYRHPYSGHYSEDQAGAVWAAIGESWWALWRIREDSHVGIIEILRNSVDAVDV